MKIRPSVDYWNTLETSIRERLATPFYRKIFFCGLFVLITVAIDSVIVVLDISI
jgi:hypothetical protein